MYYKALNFYCSSVTIMTIRLNARTGTKCRDPTFRCCVLSLFNLWGYAGCPSKQNESRHALARSLRFFIVFRPWLIVVVIVCACVGYNIASSTGSGFSFHRLSLSPATCFLSLFVSGVLVTNNNVLIVCRPFYVILLFLTDYSAVRVQFVF